MVMIAYFDESGTHGPSPTTIMAGVGGTPAQWVGIEKRLAKLYRDFGVTKFHAKDFRGSKGDFKGWNLAQKGEFNHRFLKTIDAHVSFGSVATVESDDYQASYRRKPFPPKVRPDTEYGLCFRVALRRAILFVGTSNGPLNVVLELGHKNQGDAIRVFAEEKQELKAFDDTVLGTISFASKDDCQFLALADSLAYNSFRKMAGYSKHPEDDAIPVGHSIPPFYVENVPMRRISMTPSLLSRLHKRQTDKRAKAAYARMIEEAR